MRLGGGGQEEGVQRRRFGEMACIVLNQNNKALPQPLTYGNPNRLLSSPCTRGSVATGG